MTLIINNRIKSLWAVLHDLNDIPKEGLSVHQKSEIESIVQKGHEVLLEIEDKLSKYNVLAFKTSSWKSNALRAWSRIKWDPAEVNSLRNRIMSCISLFNLVMGNINQYGDFLITLLLLYLHRLALETASLMIYSGI